MAKKGDKELSTDRRKNSSESPTETNRPSDSSNSSSNSYQTLKPLNPFLIFLVIPIISVIVYRILYGHAAVSVVRSVYDRDLIKTKVKYLEIIAEHSRISSNLSRVFQHPVLAYVTPWYDLGLLILLILALLIGYLSFV